MAVRKALILLASLALLLLAPGRSAAAVEIAFYSHAMGGSFPHAFITLEGSVDQTGEPVHANYGFTVKHLIGPSVLLGPVKGEVFSEKQS